MKTYLTLLIMALLLVNCHMDPSTSRAKDANRSSDDYISETLAYDEELEMEPPRTQEPASTLATEKKKTPEKIIKEGSMSIEVDSLKLAKNFIDSIVNARGAYFENEVYNANHYSKTFNLKLRIPRKQFSSFIKDLESGEGKITSKSINAKDVSAEYVDLEIREQNTRAYITQYKEILKKAKSIKDILEIQEKIRRLESELDSKIGRMNYINDKVQLSTLHLVLTQHITPINNYKPPTFLTQAWNSIKAGFSGFRTFVLILLGLWPIFIIIGILYSFRKRIFRFRRKKKETK